jgi:hypothetical protein
MLLCSEKKLTIVYFVGLKRNPSFLVFDPLVILLIDYDQSLVHVCVCVCEFV